MAHEVIDDTSKRKNKTAKAGKAAPQATPQTEQDENQIGWEEQLWFNQAAETGDTPSADWEGAHVPTLHLLTTQVGKIRQQMENGLHTLLNCGSGYDAANAAINQANGVWSDARSREEIKRWSSLLGGGFLALWGLRRSLGSLTLIGLGASLVYYALTGQWLLPTPTNRAKTPYTGRTGTTSLDSNRPMAVKNILVKAPLNEVYQAWANFETFPNFMQHIRSITKTGERTSHWVMDGPLHSRLEWDAEMTRQEENKRIAWSSTAGDIKTSGQVTFNALPDNYVEVTVMLRYIPPAGVAGDLFATLLSDPEGKLEEDLRNFKRYIEKRESAEVAEVA